MIRVEQLTKRFGELTAVNQLSFELDQGETLAIIGTSGCGKTTTLKMINRLIQPSGGKILLDGKDILQQPLAEMRRRMGYVIQNIGLFPHYTVKENIALVPRLLKWSEKKIGERVEHLLRQLKLEPDIYAEKYPDQLSGGQQQRVGIARALAADPPVILMDEPFGALDPITRRDIQRDFLELEELRNKTTILVTHDVLEAFELADRILVLDAGNLQQFSSPEELLFQPANDFVRSFLAGRLLQLELEVLSLEDIRESHPEAKILPLSPDSTVSAAMAKLAGNSRKNTLGQCDFSDGSRRHFTFRELMDAFHQKINP